MPNAFAADIADMPGKKRGKKMAGAKMPPMKKPKGAKLAKKAVAKKGKPPFGY